MGKRRKESKSCSLKQQRQQQQQQPRRRRQLRRRPRTAAKRARDPTGASARWSRARREGRGEVAAAAVEAQEQQQRLLLPPPPPSPPRLPRKPSQKRLLPGRPPPSSRCWPRPSGTPPRPRRPRACSLAGRRRRRPRLVEGRLRERVKEREFLSFKFFFSFFEIHASIHSFILFLVFVLFQGKAARFFVSSDLPRRIPHRARHLRLYKPAPEERSTSRPKQRRRRVSFCQIDGDHSTLSPSVAPRPFPAASGPFPFGLDCQEAREELPR